MAGIILKETENKYESIKELQNLHLDCAFTIGAETGGNTINVAVAFKTDKAQAALTVRRAGMAFLSSSSTGVDITGTAPSSGLAIGTNGKIISEIVADKLFYFTTDTSGRFDINLVEAGVATWYLVVVMPNG